MEIKSISAKLFRTNVKKSENQSNQASNHTNPFGVSFKGNIINADVFEEKKSDLTEKQNRGKMLVSTLVGSINAINANISGRFNSVVNFCGRVKDSTVEAWQKARSIDVGKVMADKIAFGGNYSVNNLQKRPVSELEAMLQERIAAMEA